MPDDEIEQLVARAREGEVAAFAALYEAFAPRIDRYLRHRVADPMVAEDLLQKVFLKMIEALPRYQSRGIPFAAWLFRLAHNAVIDERRTTHPRLPLEVAADRPAETPDPESAAASAFDGVLVRRALDDLRPDQREVVSCRFFAGLTPAETAHVMGRSEGAVRVLQHRALEALHRRLATDGIVTARELGQARLP